MLSHFLHFIRNAEIKMSTQSSMWFLHVYYNIHQRDATISLTHCGLVTSYGDTDLALSHHLNQCWLSISEILWHSYECHYSIRLLSYIQNVSEKCVFEITATPRRGQRVKHRFRALVVQSIKQCQGLRVVNQMVATIKAAKYGTINHQVGKISFIWIWKNSQVE